MKRLIIICEGQTEQEFCNKILQPYLQQKNITIQAPLIKKSGGGIVRWSLLQKQIEMHLQQEPNTFVSTFIDYYGINANHEFPNWESAKIFIDKNLRLQNLEQAMRSELSQKLQYRFLPYLQLHEFEGLLFSDINPFLKQINEVDFIDKSSFKAIFENNPNPELINDNPQTAPSKRLEQHISGYNKVVYGNIIAESLGLELIRSKCPRFNTWILKLEQI